MLGELESQVMEVVWARGAATVREVHEAVNRQRPLAYTTIMTVMTRLAEKGILRRELVEGAYVYRPAEPRAAFEARAASRCRASENVYSFISSPLQRRRRPTQPPPRGCAGA